MARKKDGRFAAKQNEEGLQFFADWQIDNAVTAFQAATAADPDNAEYHLNLARTFARASKYDQAMEALGKYLHLETEAEIATRYEMLFSSALDDVESLLIGNMKAMDFDIQHIGKALQMWLEYRITIGRKILRIPKPELWAAALTYAVVKVNFIEMKRADIAESYQASDRSVQQKYIDLVAALDLMPADYRYFMGEKNPLDKLVEAARLLDDLDEQFKTEE